MQRTEHFYFAVGTLGLQNIVIVIVSKWKGFTHGSGGQALNIRPLSISGTKFDSRVPGLRISGGLARRSSW